MENDVVMQFVSVQPVIVTIILFFVAIALIEMCLDFFLSIFCKRWSSPFGLKRGGFKLDKDN